MVSTDIRSKFNPDFKNFFTQSGMLAPLLIEYDPNYTDQLLAVLDTTKLQTYQNIPTFGFMGIKEGTINSAILLAQLKAVKMIHIDQTVFTLDNNQRSPRKPLDKQNIMNKNIFDIPLDFFDESINNFGRIMDNATLGEIIHSPAQFAPPAPPLTTGQASSAIPFLPPPPPLGFPPLPPFPIGQAQKEGEERHPVPRNLRKEYYSTFITRQIIGAHKAEEVGLTGRGVKVAVLDTGIDVIHPQIDPSTDADNAMIPHPNVDENGHGTHCASTIYGKAIINPYNIKIKGVAPDCIPISIKCLGGGIGTGRNSDILKAMELAYHKGAHIVSMSLGSKDAQGGLKHDPLVRAVRTLTARGMIFSIAAGNSGPNKETIGSPGCAPDALTVGAIDPKDKKMAYFSSRGPRYGLTKPDIVAPGVNIYSGTSKGSVLDGINDRVVDGFAILSGTSMACPHTSGLVAILKQQYPELTTKIIKDVCQKKGHKKTNEDGWGLMTWDWFQKVGS